MSVIDYQVHETLGMLPALDYARLWGRRTARIYAEYGVASREARIGAERTAACFGHIATEQAFLEGFNEGIRP
jgi:hypothetical protein